MFKWFMSKILIIKIIIIASSVVVICGVIAGVIIIPRVIEKQQQEQLEVERQEQSQKKDEEPNIKLNTIYTLVDYGWTVHLEFVSNSEFTYTVVYNTELEDIISKGTYIVEGNKVTLKSPDWGEKYFIIDNSDNTFELDPQYYDLDAGY